jgi:hypothetical protein
MAPRTRIGIVALAVAAGLVALTLAFILGSLTPPRLPLPNPNGYDDFLAAGKLVAGRIADHPLFDRDRLRGVVATNKEALRLLRLGLTRQCSVPTDAALTNVAGWSAELGRLKHLAHLLGDEGRWHELEGRPAEAALVYAEIIRFGNETSRGGFLIHRLVGISCEAIGCSLLAKLVPRLEGEDARPVIAELERVDGARVTWDEIRRNERKLSASGPGVGLNPVLWVRNLWQARQVSRMAEGGVKRIMAQERLLLTELGLRCYVSERGQVPAGLGVLVPDYLSRVPQDPFSRKPLVFRPQGTNWLLYSIGTDAVDDGGKPKGRGIEGKGDLFFDTPHY